MIISKRRYQGHGPAFDNPQDVAALFDWLEQIQQDPEYCGLAEPEREMHGPLVAAYALIQDESLRPRKFWHDETSVDSDLDEAQRLYLARGEHDRPQIEVTGITMAAGFYRIRAAWRQGLPAQTVLWHDIRELAIDLAQAVVEQRAESLQREINSTRANLKKGPKTLKAKRKADKELVRKIRDRLLA